MKWLLAAVAAVCLVLYGAACYFFRFAFKAHLKSKKLKQMVALDKDLVARNNHLKESGEAYFARQGSEKVHITSRDGLRLSGLLIPSQKGNKTAILFHGYRSHPLRDFAFVARFYGETLGFNLLIVDQRGSGESEGEYITFGVKEREDCALWAEWVAKRYGAEHPILLHGVSMGAATVMMAADLPLPPSVTAIVGDCGYASLDSQFRHVLKTYFHLPAFPLLPLTEAMTKRRLGFTFKSPSAAESLSKNSRPLLLLHGGRDDFVPPWMSEKNAAANGGPVHMTVVPDAGHGLSYLVDRQRCEDAMQAFTAQYFPD